MLNSAEQKESDRPGGRGYVIRVINSAGSVDNVYTRDDTVLILHFENIRETVCYRLYSE